MTTWQKLEAAPREESDEIGGGVSCPSVILCEVYTPPGREYPRLQLQIEEDIDGLKRRAMIAMCPDDGLVQVNVPSELEERSFMLIASAAQEMVRRIRESESPCELLVV